MSDNTGGFALDCRRLEIPDVVLLRPRRFEDARGSLTEIYGADASGALGLETVFVQDNLSISDARWTVRGLHAQSPPAAQAKLVMVMSGRILDVAVDVRRGSPTYGHHVGVELSAEDGWQIFVPEGFLHGFMTLEAGVAVLYKLTAPYDPSTEITVRWNDPTLGIDWGVNAVDVRASARDAQAQAFSDFSSPFGRAQG